MQKHRPDDAPPFAIVQHMKDIGIGMALGAGMYTLGIGTTVIVLILQWALHKNLWLSQFFHINRPYKHSVIISPLGFENIFYFCSGRHCDSAVPIVG